MPNDSRLANLVSVLARKRLADSNALQCTDKRNHYGASDKSLRFSVHETTLATHHQQY